MPTGPKGAGLGYVGPVTRDVLSYCRICAAACGITVTVDGERVVRVRGDAEHPVSRGYTCAKGRGLPEWHHAPRPARPTPAARRRRRAGTRCSTIWPTRSRDHRRPRAGRRRAVPRHRAGLRRRRPGGGAPCGWRRSAAAPSTPRPPSTTRRCSWPPSWWPGNADAQPGVGSDGRRAAAAGGHQPGGVPRLRHHAARPGAPPARPPPPAAVGCG